MRVPEYSISQKNLISISPIPRLRLIKNILLVLIVLTTYSCEKKNKENKIENPTKQEIIKSKKKQMREEERETANKLRAFEDFEKILTPYTSEKSKELKGFKLGSPKGFRSASPNERSINTTVGGIEGKIELSYYNGKIYQIHFSAQLDPSKITTSNDIFAGLTAINTFEEGMFKNFIILDYARENKFYDKDHYMFKQSLSYKGNQPLKIKDSRGILYKYDSSFLFDTYSIHLSICDVNVLKQKKATKYNQKILDF